MINDLLDLAKIEAQKVELEPQNFHLMDFLQNLVNIIQIQTENKGLILEPEFAADLPTEVCADKKKLGQILLNILNNAVKFTHEGTITFSVKQDSTSLASNARLHFSVSDTGIGISQDKLEETFLPFHRVADKSQQFEGTGLGLAISQKFALLMDSKLHVTSQLGEGSTFWLDLDVPVSTESADSASILNRYKKLITIRNTSYFHNSFS